MRKVIGSVITLAACGAVALGVMSGAGAATGRDIGTPGAKNCQGQTTAWAAQALHDYGYNGIKGFVEAYGYTDVQQLKDAIEAYCTV